MKVTFSIEGPVPNLSTGTMLRLVGDAVEVEHPRMAILHRCVKVPLAAFGLQPMDLSHGVYRSMENFIRPCISRLGTMPVYDVGVGAQTDADKVAIFVKQPVVLLMCLSITVRI